MGASAVPIPPVASAPRSEEHTSELQSQSNLVCRLLLEKKKKRGITPSMPTRLTSYIALLIFFRSQRCPQLSVTVYQQQLSILSNGYKLLTHQHYNTYGV